MAIHALAWRGDTPVDPSAGFGPRQGDRAVFHGDFAVVYPERGTSARVFEGGEPLREIPRAEYHAEDYDYPVAIGSVDGRDVLVHCPEEYNRLEIDDLRTGERLTAGERTPEDCFHSRLSISPDGRHLLVAGWVWHPYGIVQVFDLRKALTDPAHLDGAGVLPMSPGLDAEVASACWLDADRVAVATNEETLHDEDGDGPDVDVQTLAVWSLSRAGWISVVRTAEALGTIFARSGEEVLALHGHPRVLRVATAEVTGAWPEVEVPTRDGAFGVTHMESAVAAVRADGRMAVASGPEIVALG